MCHSKTKNRQWILFVSSRTEKESGKEENLEICEDEKLDGIIR